MTSAPVWIPVNCDLVSEDVDPRIGHRVRSAEFHRAKRDGGPMRAVCGVRLIVFNAVDDAGADVATVAFNWSKRLPKGVTRRCPTCKAAKS